MDSRLRGNDGGGVSARRTGGTSGNGGGTSWNDGGTSGNDGGTSGNDETCSPDSGRLATLLGGYGVGVSRRASLYPCGYTRRTLRLPDRGTAVDPGGRSFVGGRGGEDGSALFTALESACWTARGVQSTTHRDRISAESGNQDDVPMDVMLRSTPLTRSRALPRASSFPRPHQLGS